MVRIVSAVSRRRKIGARSYDEDGHISASGRDEGSITLAFRVVGVLLSFPRSRASRRVHACDLNELSNGAARRVGHAMPHHRLNLNTYQCREFLAPLACID